MRKSAAYHSPQLLLHMLNHGYNLQLSENVQRRVLFHSRLAIRKDSPVDIEPTEFVGCCGFRHVLAIFHSLHTCSPRRRQLCLLLEHKSNIKKSAAYYRSPAGEKKRSFPDPEENRVLAHSLAAADPPTTVSHILRPANHRPGYSKTMPNEPGRRKKSSELWHVKPQTINLRFSSRTELRDFGMHAYDTLSEKRGGGGTELHKPRKIANGKTQNQESPRVCGTLRSTKKK